MWQTVNDLMYVYKSDRAGQIDGQYNEAATRMGNRIARSDTI